MVLADQPGAQVRSGNRWDAPLHGISAERKRPVGVLRGVEREAELHDGRVGLRLHVCVQQTPVDELHQLARDDLELPRGRVRVKDRGTGYVLWGGLEILVEVGRFNCADPVVTALERGSWEARTPGAS